MSTGFGYRAPDTSTDLGAMGLLERAESVAAVSRLLDRARARTGSCLFIRAGAGLGKSSLLSEAQRMAAEEFRLGVSRGDAMETWFPFGLVTPALEQLGGPDLVGASSNLPAGADARAARFISVLRWLQADPSQPIVVILDDLHWADTDSLALVAFLARRLADQPVALLASLRPWPSDADEVVSALAKSGHAAVEDLSPLSLDAASELIDESVGHPVDHSILERAHRLCAGNPLLLKELAAAIKRGDPVPELPGRVAPLSHSLLLARFAGLPSPALRCAEAGSVLGQGFRVDVAAEMVELDGVAAAAAVDALSRSGLISSTGGSAVDFVHPMFAQALYQHLAPAVRALLHRRAFHILSRLGLETDAAEHALRGDLAGDPEAVRSLETAGRAALSAGAVAAAVTHFESAVKLAGDRATVTLFLALGEAQLAAGQLVDARVNLDRLLLRGALSGQDRGRALSMLAQASYLSGDAETARSVFQSAIPHLEEHAVPAAIDALLHQCFNDAFTEGPAVALALADRAQALATSQNDQTRRRAQAVAAAVRLLAGDASGYSALAEASHALEVEPVAFAADALSWTGVTIMYGGAAVLCEDFDEAQRVYGIALATAEDAGAATSIVGIGAQKAWMFTRLGRLPEALDLLATSAGLVDVVPYAEGYVLVGQASVLLLMGRLHESEALCQRAESIGARRGQTNVLIFVHEVRGHRALREGRTLDAAAQYAALEDLVHRTGVREPCLATWARHAVSAYLSCNQASEAQRLVAWLESCSKDLPCTWPQIAAATGRALLAWQGGDFGAADAEFQRALSLHRVGEQPIEEAQSLLEYGTFLRRTGQRGRARPFLARALELAEGSGAYWIGGFVRAELNAAGGRRRKQQPPDLLTAQESRVAELAAAGLSNRDMSAQLSVSNATIETHLQRVYSKLDIHSRRELMLKAHAARGSVV